MLPAHLISVLEYCFFKVNAGPVALLVDRMATYANRRIMACRNKSVTLFSQP